MKIFSILKIDYAYSLKHYPSDRLRLDPTAITLKQSGVTTCPIDKVSVLVACYHRLVPARSDFLRTRRGGAR
jgi:hypothetical protein